MTSQTRAVASITQAENVKMLPHCHQSETESSAFSINVEQIFSPFWIQSKVDKAFLIKYIQQYHPTITYDRFIAVPCSSTCLFNGPQHIPWCLNTRKKAGTLIQFQTVLCVNDNTQGMCMIALILTVVITKTVYTPLSDAVYFGRQAAL